MNYLKYTGLGFIGYKIYDKVKESRVAKREPQQQQRQQQQQQQKQQRREPEARLDRFGDQASHHGAPLVDQERVDPEHEPRVVQRGKGGKGLK